MHSGYFALKLYARTKDGSKTKSLATKHEGPSWVPQDPDVVEGANQSHKLDSNHCGVSMCIHKINTQFLSFADY